MKLKQLLAFNTSTLPFITIYLRDKLKTLIVLV